MRVLVFGASVTQGFWDTEGGWVQRLRKYYDEKFLNGLNEPMITVFNLGVSGDTAKDVLKRFKNEVTHRMWPGEAFIIIFAVGTNDSMIENGKFRSTPETYSEELISLVEQAKVFTDDIIMVGLTSCDETKTSPVAWAPVAYGNDRIKKFEAIIAEVCSQNGLVHVPIFDAFHKENQKRSLLSDGLHPNDEGHQLIYKLVKPKVEKLV